jgi:hypothetical protein
VKSVRLQVKTISKREDGCFSGLAWRTEEEARLGLDGRPIGVSVERTFENLRTVIGNGIFLCVRDYYIKGGYETFEINVEGHTRVLFHKGALEDHSRACVILAESFGGYDRAKKAYAQRADGDDQTAVLGSSAGFDEFMKLASGLDEFYMEVSGR